MRRREAGGEGRRGLGFRGTAGGLEGGLWRGETWGRERRASPDGEGGVGVEEDGGVMLSPSFTLPNKGGGAPGVPGRWRGGA